MRGAIIENAERRDRLKIGVLALQGAFVEHITMLESLGVEAVEVRKAMQLAGLDGLIIPGGESTTLGKLATTFGLIEPIRSICRSGKPVWGTCAGMILLARDIGRERPWIGVLDVEVRRNGFGRQVDSFELDLDIPALAPEGPFHCIFIRAPRIAGVGRGVEVLARLAGGEIIAVRQVNLLVTSFHPELTGDTRFHRLFVEACSAARR